MEAFIRDSSDQALGTTILPRRLKLYHQPVLKGRSNGPSLSGAASGDRTPCAQTFLVPTLSQRARKNGAPNIKGDSKGGPPVELGIRFRDSGKSYFYLNVPPEEYDALMASPSKGGYLNQVFK